MVASVFAVLPRTLIEYGISLGLDRVELYAVAGLSEANTADPDALVPYDSLPSLWRHYSERFRDTPIGMNYGQRADIRLFGVVGQACMNAPTLGDALEMSYRYSRLIDPYARNRVVDDDERTVAILDHEPRVLALPEVMEMLVAASCAIGRQLADQLLRPLRVSFRHPRRHALSVYEDYFQSEVVFRADAYSLEYARVDLSVCPRGANPLAGRYLARAAEELRATIEGRDHTVASDPLIVRLRDAIERSLAKGLVRESAVAKILGVSSRSLQRALQERGTSFSNELVAVRQGRALTLLGRPELSAAEVAFMLGYADARSFYRGFREWYGTSPGEYRKRLAPP